MQVNCTNCNDIRKCVLLKSRDARKNEERTFITDKHHLEIVLGPSQESWFESLTACQIQNRKANKVKQRWSMIDSPSSSPSISQLIQGQLAVGSSPAGWRHSSPVRFSDQDDGYHGNNVHNSFDIPQSDSWERPSLGLSPGPSPIVHSIATLSRTSSGGVYSLGLDDSTMSWTNSLATPPRDGSKIESFDDEADLSLSKTKDTARALFSPGGRLDYTADSIRPLDSTFEEEQSDFDGSQSESLQTSLPQSKADGKQTDNVSFESPSVKSSLDVSLSQEVMSKADILKQSPTEIKHMENWKDNFKKRLISRKDSLLESAKKFKTKEESSLSCAESDNNDSKTEKSLSNKLQDSSCQPTNVPSHSKNENIPLSPTFSQKKKQSKQKTKKSPYVSRSERSSVDYVLSDFFDPPSASVGKRKPAPSRKRKSLEMEESLNISETANVSCNNSNLSLSDTTPMALQSILASDKKSKGSSGKKVRFSENVKKCTFIPEVDSCMKTKKNVEKVSKGKRSSLKIKGASMSMQLKNKSTDVIPENVNQKILGNKDESKSDKTVIQNEHQNSNKKLYNKRSEETSCRQNNESSKQKADMKSKEEASEEELFSQVSPSALSEMCDEAEKHENSTIDSRKATGSLREAREKKSDKVTILKAKKFFYPSFNQLTSANKCKVFQYKEDEQQVMNRKALLSSVKIKDIVDTDVKEQIELEEKGPVCGDEKNNLSKQTSDEKWTVTICDGVLKDSVMDYNLMEHRKSPGQKKPPEISGFQSASGRQEKVPQEALEKATGLFQKEFTDKESSYYSDVQAINQDFKQVKGLVKSTKCKKAEKNVHLLSLPEQSVHQQIREKTSAPVIKPESTKKSQSNLRNSGIANTKTLFKGFESASGKALNIPTEALSKALRLFDEDNIESTIKESLKAKNNVLLSECIPESMTKELKSNVVMKTDTAGNLVHKMIAPNDEKLVPRIRENVKGRSSNVSYIEVNSLQGFQSASGKAHHIPDKALEKARILLHDDKLLPSSCSRLVRETEDARKMEENNAAHELCLMNDMEFSEWFDDEMEPEGILFAEENVKDRFDDTENEGDHLNDLKVRKPEPGKDDKKNDISKKLMGQVNSNKERAKEIRVTNDTNEKVTFIETENLKTKEVLEKVKGIDKTKEFRDCNYFNEPRIQENKDHSKLAFAHQKEDFVGFQTASGKSMALSEEKIKQAEQLLIDTGSENVLDLKEHLDIRTVKPVLKNNIDIRTGSEADTLPENMSLMQIDGTLKLDVKREKHVSVTASVGIPWSKESLVHKPELAGDKEGNNSLLKTCDFIEKVNKTKEKDNSKLSVAERLKLEFENEVINKSTETKNIEDELNEIINFKKSREVGEKKEKLQSSSLGSRCIQAKQCADTKNKPKGFRPFKPPKLCRAANSGKYPESKTKDWNNQNAVDQTNSTCYSQGSIEGKGRKQVMDGSDLKISDSNNIKICGLEGSERKESRLENCSNNDISKYEKLTTVSRSEHYETKTNLNNSKGNTSFDDIVCMSNRNFAEINTSAVIESGDIKIVNNSTANAICKDLDDFSQMFDDEMDFTQIESSEHVINSRKDKVDSDDSKEVKHGTLGGRKYEQIKIVTRHDFPISCGNENLNCVAVNEMTDHGEKIYKTKKEDVYETNQVNCNEPPLKVEDKKHTGSKDFVGFSSASGKVISVSKSAVKSAEQMLSNYDEGDSINLNIECVKESGLNKIIKLKETSRLNTDGGNTSGYNTLDKEVYLTHDDLEQDLKDEEKMKPFDHPSDEKLCEENGIVEKRSCKQNSIDSLEFGTFCHMSESGLNDTKSKVVIENEQTVVKNSHSSPKITQNDQVNECLLADIVNKTMSNERKNKDNLTNDTSSIPDSSENEIENTDKETDKGTVKNVKVSEPFDTQCGLKDSSSNDLVKTVKEGASDTLSNITDTASRHINKNSKIVKMYSESLQSDNLGTDDNSIVLENTVIKESGKDDNGIEVNFQTPSSSNVHVLEKSIEYTRVQFQDNINIDNKSVSDFDDLRNGLGDKVNVFGNVPLKNEEDKVQNVPKFDGFSTVARNKIDVSEKALSYAMGQLQDIKEKGIDQNVSEFEGFITASGNKVHVSDKALNFARGKLQEADEMDKTQNVPNSEEFSAASGNKILICDKALSYARGQMKDKIDKAEKFTNFEGFSTASGISVIVSDKALTCTNGELQETGDMEKVQNVPKFEGFVTASGNKVHVSGKALSHAREQLQNTDEVDNPQNMPEFGCFSTAAGNKIHVSKRALSYLQDIEETEKAQNVPKFEGLSTASGNKIQVSNTALKYARGQLQDMEETEDVQNVPKFERFSTASGNKVHISERALSYAREQLQQTDEVYNPQNVPKFEGFSTAAGSKVHVSEKALSYARGQLKDIEETEKAQNVPKFVRFCTGHGNKVHVSEEALNNTKGQLQDIEMTAKAQNVSKFEGFSATSGNKVHVSDKTLNDARGHLQDTEESENVQNVPKFEGFNAASGNKVHVYDKTLNDARGHLQDIEEKENVQNVPKFEGFSTALGNKVCVSDKALNYARGQLHDIEEKEKPQTVPKFESFSTASGNEVHVPDQALNDARGHLPDIEETEKAQNVQKFEGFSTASGNKVHVSDSTLNYASVQLQDIEETDKAKNVPKFEGFSTASGNKVHVSDKALNYARGQLQDIEETVNAKNVPKFEGFSTASGNKVHVSDKALNYARGQLQDIEETEKAQNVQKFEGFSTASGNKVQVSDKALNYARGQLQDIEETDIAKNVPKYKGFITASGNKVHVSDSALNYASGQLKDIEETDNAKNVPKFEGFSTASGNKVHVSDKALNYAREQLQDIEEIDNAKNVPKFEGFSTASGNKVHVSDKALNYARGQLQKSNEIDIAQNVPKFEGFSTASGNKVHVSEKALSCARGQFQEEIDKAQNVPKFEGFSTASGNKVGVSKSSLEYAVVTLNKAEGSLCEMKDNQRNSEKFSSVDTDLNRTDIAENITIKRQSGHNNGHMEQSGLNSGVFNKGMKEESYLEQDDTKVSEKCGSDDDLEEMFGMALKRRKITMNKERKMLHKLEDEGPLSRRKSAGSSNAVSEVSTDKRHPGFRPFKPVFCKNTDKRGDRQDVTSVYAQDGKATIAKSDIKSSFQTPYRNKTRKPNIPHSRISPEKKLKTGFVSNSEMDFTIGGGDGVHNGLPSETTLEISSSGDCKDTSMIQSVSSDKIKMMNLTESTEYPVSLVTSSDNNNQSSKGDKSAVDTILQRNIESYPEISMGKSGTQNSVDSESSKTLLRLETVPVKTNEKSCVNSNVLETGEKSEQSEFDSFSQDEDDVYYCTLVEARRHQDDIIKEKASNRVRPVAGKLLQMKQRDKRLKLKDVIDKLNQVLDRHPQVMTENAANYKFSMEFYYGKNTAHAKVGDGAYIVPDDAGNIGKQEFYRGFLTLEGVDAKLVSNSWVFNHYRWIVWKLSSYENTSSCLKTRSLTPDMVMSQLKYRYDREVDLSQRSSLKKIYERDDTPSKRLVLCVAAVRRIDLGETTVDQTKSSSVQKVLLELTDGWYSIPTQIDGPLTQLVLKDRICVGHKLCITGADLVGGEDACTPLEAPSSIMLKICRNSTRPAPWDSILGYQLDPRPLCVPLSGLDGDGGIAGVIDVVIVRKYPTLYMEKFEGGGCIFRTQRCEDRERQEFDTHKQREMEKVYRQMEDMAEKEEKLERRKNGMKKFKRSEIEDLQSGQDIYDAMESAAQPDMIQNYLSDGQLAMLYDYKRQQKEEKQADLNSKFSKAWQEKLETFKERVVTPVMKLRVAGCANRDLDLKTSTVLTVWRPAPEISDLQEGHRYKIYSLNTSMSRMKYTGHSVQLTATKQTRFRRMQLDENILDNIYEPREVLWSSDIRRRQPPFGELDFVGVIVKIAKSSLNDRMCDMVYLADCQLGILAVRFWSGFKSFGEDLFTVGHVLCCSNLMDKSPYRYSQIPIVEVSPEFTHITNKSQNAAQRKALEKINVAAKDKAGFIEKAISAVETLSIENKNQSIPKKILEITEDFISGFSRRNKGTCEKTYEQLNLDNMDDIDLADDSFEADIKEEKTHVESSSVVDNTDSHSAVNNTDAIKQDGGLEVTNEITDNDVNLASCSDIAGTPQNDRKRSIAQTNMARLMSYGSPSVLSPLNVSVPRSVSKGFKPPSFKKF